MSGNATRPSLAGLLGLFQAGEKKRTTVTSFPQRSEGNRNLLRCCSPLLRAGALQGARASPALPQSCWARIRMTSGFRIKSRVAEAQTPQSVTALVRSLTRAQEGEDLDSGISSSEEEAEVPPPARGQLDATNSPRTPLMPGRGHRPVTNLSAQRSFLSSVVRPSLANRSSAAPQRGSTQTARHAEGSLQALLGQSQPQQQQVLNAHGRAGEQLSVTAITQQYNVWVVTCDSHDSELPGCVHLLIRPQVAEEVQCAVGQTLHLTPPWYQLDAGDSVVLLPSSIGLVRTEDDHR